MLSKGKIGYIELQWSSIITHFMCTICVGGYRHLPYPTKKWCMLQNDLKTHAFFMFYFTFHGRRSVAF